MTSVLSSRACDFRFEDGVCPKFYGTQSLNMESGMQSSRRLRFHETGIA